jgi:hypothetical protein
MELFYALISMELIEGNMDGQWNLVGQQPGPLLDHFSKPPGA